MRQARRAADLAFHAPTALSQYGALCRSFDVADFTPDNSRLTISQWQELSVELRGARLIISLRHPVARAWSQIRMGVRNGWHPLPTSPEALLDLLQSDGFRRVSLSTHKIHSLREIFDGRTFLTSLDEIAEDPARLTERLADFIGIGAWVNIPGAVHRGTAIDLPPTLGRFLHAYFAKDIEELSGLAGRPLRI